MQQKRLTKFVAFVILRVKHSIELHTHISCRLSLNDMAATRKQPRYFNVSTQLISTPLMQMLLHALQNCGPIPLTCGMATSNFTSILSSSVVQMPTIAWRSYKDAEIKV